MLGVSRSFAGAVAAAAAVAAVLAVPSHAQSSGYHVDERLGFKLKPPRGWAEIPLKQDEQWLAAKYLSDKTYYFNDPDTGWSYEHKPELMVIAFVQRDDEKSEDGPVVEKGDEGEHHVVAVDNPYANYQDFLDRTYQGGGFYVAEQKDGEQGGIPVTRISIKVEKLASSGPKEITTWVYHLDGLDVAVQIEVLQDQASKLKRTVEGVLRSFKEIPRKADALPDQEVTSDWITITMMEEGTPAQRRERRMASELQRRERARKSLADGWSADRMGRCFVISHVDDRTAKRIAGQVDALFDWLEETLPFVGPETYVREPILRICANEDELDSYTRGRNGGGGGAWIAFGATSEIDAYDDKLDWGDYQNQFLNDQAFAYWFSERDLELYWALPTWVSAGLEAYVGEAKLDGRELEFGVDLWIKDDLRDLVRSGGALSPREIMHMTGDRFWASDGWNDRNQAAALVHFFLSGAAAHDRRTKDVFPRYVENLQAIIQEIQKESAAADEKEEKPKTEEEEDRWYKERQEAWKKEEARVLDEAFTRTFGGWSENDWDDFAKVYFDSIH